MAGALRGPGCWAPSQFTLQPARPWSWSWLLLPSGQKPGTLTSYSPLGHSRAGSKPAESTHSQQDPEPETAGDGGEGTTVRQPTVAESVWDFHASPALGGGLLGGVCKSRVPGGLGGGLAWLRRGWGCGSQGADLDSAGTGESE